jgi:hypothetical protein
MSTIHLNTLKLKYEGDPVDPDESSAIQKAGDEYEVDPDAYLHPESDGDEEDEEDEEDEMEMESDEPELDSDEESLDEDEIRQARYYKARFLLLSPSNEKTDTSPPSRTASTKSLSRVDASSARFASGSSTFSPSRRKENRSSCSLTSSTVRLPSSPSLLDRLLSRVLMLNYCR